MTQLKCVIDAEPRRSSPRRDAPGRQPPVPARRRRPGAAPSSERRELEDERARVVVASQWQLMLLALPEASRWPSSAPSWSASSTWSRCSAEFVAPYDPEQDHATSTGTSRRPRSRFFDPDGRLHRLARASSALTSTRDPVTLRISLRPGHRPSGTRSSFFVRGRRVQALGPVPERRPPVRARAGRAAPDPLPVRDGSARPGRLLAHHLRGAPLALDRPGRRLLSFVLGIILGGISGYYGGAIDTADPARHRVPALDPPDPALDGAGGGDPAELARPVHLLRDHADPLADQLDRPGARRPGPLPVAARGGLRAGGPAVRRASEPRIIFRHMLPSFSSATSSPR